MLLSWHWEGQFAVAMKANEKKNKKTLEEVMAATDDVKCIFLHPKQTDYLGGEEI